MKRKIGVGIIIGSMAIFAIDRFLFRISDKIGRLICGDRYMLPVDGILGDPSCGFNSDMHLAAFLFLALVIGLGLVIASAIGKKRR